MRTAVHVTLVWPGWIDEFVGQLPARLTDDEERMAVAIELSRRNVERQTGGPFGALVVEQNSGRVVAAAVNRVDSSCCSTAHAEILALSLAQQTLGTWNLAAVPSAPLQLVSSCEPCAMCLGALPWSGVRSLLCGASKQDAEAAGFDEGDRPCAWIEGLQGRGIVVTTKLLREQAARVLSDYRERGGRLYQPAR